MVYYWIKIGDKVFSGPSRDLAIIQASSDIGRFLENAPSEEELESGDIILRDGYHMIKQLNDTNLNESFIDKDPEPPLAPEIKK